MTYCPKCSTDKPETSFHRNRAKHDGLSWYCRDCERQRSHDRQHVSRNANLWLKYGITEDAYQEMLKKQNGVCAICQQPETQTYSRSKQVRNLAVDHDHKSGKVRGLLCCACNTALGSFRDNTVVMRNAIGYLERSARPTICQRRSKS
jgi:hypothetical protein